MDNRNYNIGYNAGGNYGANGSMNNGSYGMQGGYINNGYNSSNGYNGNNRKNKSRLGLGIGIGLLIGVLVSFLLVFMFIGAFASNGMIKIGANGEIYVQAVDVDNADGIGTAVEGKLNALDSLLDRFYFEDVDKQKATDAMFKAYLAAYGDKYTVYYTPEEYEALMTSTSGTFYGIGAVCQKNDDGTILIADPYEDAPAYKAGIRKGDCVTKVDGIDVTDMDISSATALIKGEKGTSVKLEIIRDGVTMTFNVVRDEVKVKTIEYEMLEGDIGYIIISEFDDVTVSQFKAALTALKSKNMKGLVIDVRDNPGGVLSVVVDILDEIVPKGLIVYTEDKSGNRKDYNGSNSAELSVPLAVLVNGNSASASEIFAGAIQDYGKGAIIGTQTFGKGIVQTIQPLSDGSAVKFTIAKYYTPKGQDIHGKGVTPDKVVELPDDAASDVQLEAAIGYVKEKIGE